MEPVGNRLHLNSEEAAAAVAEMEENICLWPKQNIIFCLLLRVTDPCLKARPNPTPKSVEKQGEKWLLTA